MDHYFNALKLNFAYQKIVSFNFVGTYLIRKAKYNEISLNMMLFKTNA